MEDPRAGGLQSVNRSVNKQIASLLNSGRVEGRDRPRAGGMLRARARARCCSCSCSCSTAQMLMQAVRGAGGRAVQGSLSVGPRPAPGSWQIRSALGAQLPFLFRHLAACLPQQTLTLELGAFYLDDYAPARLISRSSINLSSTWAYFLSQNASACCVPDIPDIQAGWLVGLILPEPEKLEPWK